MPAFALPQAVSPRVAATLSRFAHYPVLDRVCQRARTYDITPMAQPVGRGKPQGHPHRAGGRLPAPRLGLVRAATRANLVPLGTDARLLPRGARKRESPGFPGLATASIL